MKPSGRATNRQRVDSPYTWAVPGYLPISSLRGEGGRKAGTDGPGGRNRITSPPVWVIKASAVPCTLRLRLCRQAVRAREMDICYSKYIWFTLSSRYPAKQMRPPQGTQ